MKKLYLGRSLYNNYEVFNSCKDFEQDYGCKGTSQVLYCSKNFEKLTGIKLKIGQVKEVKIIKLKNGFKFEVGKEIKIN